MNSSIASQSMVQYLCLCPSPLSIEPGPLSPEPDPGGDSPPASIPPTTHSKHLARNIVLHVHTYSYYHRLVVLLHDP